MVFSVLLSVYSKESSSFLLQSLNSILSQTRLPDEIILVKDGPLTKELDSIIDNYRDSCSILRVIPLSYNQGLGKALNVGLQHCSYDIVARMDTDDIAKSDRFEKQLLFLDNNPEIGVVGSWIDEFDGDIDNIISIRKLPETSEDILLYAKLRNPINHPTVMFRKDLVLAVGGYQHCPFFEDYYLWTRMLAKGVKFYNIQESLLYFRCSSEMYKRRGGWKYTIYEYHFQKIIRKLGFISLFEFMRNVLTRSITRVLPNYLRHIIYKKVLRCKYV